MSAQDLADRANAISSSGIRDAEAAAERGTASGLREAKRLLTAVQRDLRELKRQAAEAERQLKLSAQGARAKTANSGQFIGMLGGGKTRSALARGRAVGRQSIAKQEAAALTPYRSVRAGIDRQIGVLETAKDRITAQLEGLTASPSPTRTSPAITVANRQREASGPSLPPPPTPAQWAPDPHGRHELRYWNGTQWTEHVSDGGHQGTDRL
jgi:hypothetical protein